eukprot:sb/3478858/
MGDRYIVQSDPDLPGPDLPESRFTGRVNFPQNRKFTVFDPDLPGKTLSPEHPGKSGSDCIRLVHYKNNRQTYLSSRGCYVLALLYICKGRAHETQSS